MTTEEFAVGDIVSVVHGPFACRVGAVRLVSDIGLVIQDEDDYSLFGERLEWCVKHRSEPVVAREPMRVISYGALKR